MPNLPNLVFPVLRVHSINIIDYFAYFGKSASSKEGKSKSNSVNLNYLSVESKSLPLFANSYYCEPLASSSPNRYLYLLGGNYNKEEGWVAAEPCGEQQTWVQPMKKDRATRWIASGRRSYTHIRRVS